MTDRKVVVEEEIFDRQEAARFLKLGSDKFDKLYRVCADYQGGKTVTYKKSKLVFSTVTTRCARVHGRFRNDRRSA